MPEQQLNSGVRFQDPSQMMMMGHGLQNQSADTMAIHTAMLDAVSQNKSAYVRQPDGRSCLVMNSKGKRIFS